MGQGQGKQSMKDIKHFCKIFEYALSITANIRCLAALFTIAAFLAACQPNSTTTAPEPSLTQPAQPNPKSTSPHSQLIKELTETVELAIKTGIDADEFQTGSKRFNSEWAAGSYQMAVLGMGQRIIANPELKPLLLPLMEKAIAQLLTPKLNQFGTDAWQEEGLTTLNANNGHAYLGYTNLALSMLRFIEPKNQFADMSDSLTQALVQRTIAAPTPYSKPIPTKPIP